MKDDCDIFYKLGKEQYFEIESDVFKVDFDSAKELGVYKVYDPGHVLVASAMTTCILSLVAAPLDLLSV